MGSRVAGVVVAAGSGARLGAEVPKAFVEVAGRPLVAWALGALRAAGLDQLVVVVPSELVDRASSLGDDVVVVAGGATRTASVAAGLAVVDDDVAVVAVHDAARPFVAPEIIAAVVAAVARRDPANVASPSMRVVGAAPGLPVADTLKRVDDHATIVATVDRADLVAIQTPQVFPRDVLAQAHAHAISTGDSATDDLALVEDLLGRGVVEGRVVTIPGSALGFKITHPADLAVARAVGISIQAEAHPPSRPSTAR